MVGLGAAGVAVTKILMDAGVRHVVGADSRGALSHRARRLPRRLDAGDQALVRRGDQPGPASTARPPTLLDGMDLFIGLSGAASSRPRRWRA